MKLLTELQLNSSHIAQIKHTLPELEIITHPHADSWTVKDLKDIDFILGYPRPDTVKNAPNLKYLQLTSSGFELYSKDSYPFLIASATGAYGQTVGEYILTSLLAFYHNLHLYRDNQRNHIWKNAGPITTIQDQKILIIGTGSIGSHFAKLLKTFGAAVYGVTRSKCLSPEAFDKVYPSCELDTILPSVDVAVLCIPGSTENHHLFNLNRLKLLRHGSLLINVGRGDIVDTEALCHVLNSGHLFGAILDVTDPEPLPSKHPLWSYPNVMITPHDAGGFQHMTSSLIQTIVSITCENLKRYSEHEPLLNQIQTKKA